MQNISETLSNVEIYPGLIEELQKNLKLQETASKCVSTDIYNEVGDLIIRVLKTYELYYTKEGMVYPEEGKKDLFVVLRFDREENDLSEEREQNFKKMPYYPFFKSKIQGVKVPDGTDWYNYGIALGDDVETAARLISEIMQQIFNVRMDSKEEDNYLKSWQEAWQEGLGLSLETIKNLKSYKPWVVAHEEIVNFFSELNPFTMITNADDEIPFSRKQMEQKRIGIEETLEHIKHKLDERKNLTELLDNEVWQVKKEREHEEEQVKHRRKIGCVIAIILLILFFLWLSTI